MPKARQARVVCLSGAIPSTWQQSPSGVEEVAIKPLGPHGLLEVVLGGARGVGLVHDHEVGLILLLILDHLGHAFSGHT